MALIVSYIPGNRNSLVQHYN